MRIWPRKQKNQSQKVKPNDPAEPEFGKAALDVFGAAILEYIRALSLDEIARRSAEVTVDAISTQSELAEAAAILDREGIVIVRNFLSAEALERGEAAADKVKAALASSSPQENFEDDAILVQSAEHVVSGYQKLAEHPKTVASIRQGADAGMVDVFNADGLVGEHRDSLRAPFVQDWLLELIREEGKELQAENLNLYLNRGIQATRGFHADAYKKSLKGFVYLSDVTCIDDGPYCFVKRSHKDGPWRRANQKISELAAAKTEAPFVDVSMVLPVIAPKGSFILSDQAGIHRGIPQSPEAERRVLVMRYK